MFVVTGAPLSLHDVAKVAREGVQVQLSAQAVDAIAASHAAMNTAIGTGHALYGINTGFGSFAQTRIDDDAIRAVQQNLIRSHAAGVGPPLDAEIVRGMMVILIASLSRGRSGARVELVQALVGMLNADVIPVVPSVGSVGASGDLAPLAHIALALIGEGEAVYGGAKLPSAVAMEHAGLTPFTLGPKEGLALINGTHMMAATAALALIDIDRVVRGALVAAAMSIDACRGTDAFLDPRVHEIRGQLGQIAVAASLEGLIAGSTIIPSHLHDDRRVQDPYCLRCTPQVVGAALDALTYCRQVVVRELGAVTDNPLVMPLEPDKRIVVSAGNFHGMPLAIAMDTAAIALTHVAGIAERRVYYILKASDAENPLNPHLSPAPGLHSGLMITQYTAAACVNELITLATPASVSNIPTSAGIEDYNSMGATSARQLRQAVDRAASVIAIELLCAAEALEYQRPLRSGDAVEAVHERVRAVVPKLVADRPPAPDIEAIRRLILDDAFADLLELP